MANSLVKTKKKFSVAIQEDKYKALINNTLGNPKKAERFIAAISYFLFDCFNLTGLVLPFIWYNFFKFEYLVIVRKFFNIKACNFF